MKMNECNQHFVLKDFECFLKKFLVKTLRQRGYSKNSTKMLLITFYYVGDYFACSGGLLQFSICRDYTQLQNCFA